jgi:hypothetical protein
LPFVTLIGGAASMAADLSIILRTKFELVINLS